MKSRPLLRSMHIGAWIGGVLGALFAVAVVLFADCAGPDCLRERITGVLLHAGAGAVAGGIVGITVRIVWNVLRSTGVGKG